MRWRLESHFIYKSFQALILLYAFFNVLHLPVIITHFPAKSPRFSAEKLTLDMPGHCPVESQGCRQGVLHCGYRCLWSSQALVYSLAAAERSRGHECGCLMAFIWRKTAPKFMPKDREMKHVVQITWKDVSDVFIDVTKYEWTSAEAVKPVNLYPHGLHPGFTLGWTKVGLYNAAMAVLKNESRHEFWKPPVFMMW